MASRRARVVLALYLEAANDWLRRAAFGEDFRCGAINLDTAPAKPNPYFDLLRQTTRHMMRQQQVKAAQAEHDRMFAEWSAGPRAQAILEPKVLAPEVALLEVLEAGADDQSRRLDDSVFRRMLARRRHDVIAQAFAIVDEQFGVATCDADVPNEDDSTAPHLHPAIAAEFEVHLPPYDFRLPVFLHPYATRPRNAGMCSNAPCTRDRICGADLHLTGCPGQVR